MQEKICIKNRASKSKTERHVFTSQKAYLSQSYNLSALHLAQLHKTIGNHAVQKFIKDNDGLLSAVQFA
jgi:hypothetical protein